MYESSLTTKLLMPFNAEQLKEYTKAALNVYPVHFAGHGQLAKSTSLYHEESSLDSSPSPSDEESELDRLLHNFEGIETPRIVVLNACQSGSLDWSLLKKDLEQMALAYGPLLHFIAYRILDNYHSAQDVVQEALLKAYEAMKGMSEERLRTLNSRRWLAKIVWNTAQNYRKRESRWVHLDLAEDSFILRIESNRYERPEIVVVRLEGESELRMLVNALPSQYAAVINRRFFFDGAGVNSDDSYESVAHDLGLPVGTVKCYIHRGLQLLRKAIKARKLQMRDLGLVPDYSNHNDWAWKSLAS